MAVFQLLGLLQGSPAAAKPQVYFSPGGGARDQIIRQINLSRYEIDLALFDLTSGEIADSLAHAFRRGVRVRGIIDRRQSRGKHSEVPFLTSSGVPLRLLSGRGRGLMHHKFAVFDGRLLITGSYNWTESAERYNYENLLVLDEASIVSVYQREFNRLWNRAVPLQSETPGLPDVVYSRWRRLLNWILRQFD